VLLHGVLADDLRVPTLFRGSHPCGVVTSDQSALFYWKFADPSVGTPPGSAAHLPLLTRQRIIEIGWHRLSDVPKRLAEKLSKTAQGEAFLIIPKTPASSNQ